ncbi:hypothetical protein HDU88_002069 [Geranomyces variabilis]|nr:hypothetical protein HDU88_002069 [Geranomyces variabilis]
MEDSPQKDVNAPHASPRKAMPTASGDGEQEAAADVAQPKSSIPVAERQEINFLQNFPQWDYTVRDEPDTPIPQTTKKTRQRAPPPRPVIANVRVPQTYQSLAKKNRADANFTGSKPASSAALQHDGRDVVDCKARTLSMSTVGQSSRSAATRYEYPPQGQTLHHVRRPRYLGRDDECGPQLVQLPPENMSSHHYPAPQQQYNAELAAIYPPAAQVPEPATSYAYQLPLQFQQHGRGASYPGHGWAVNAASLQHHPALAPYETPTPHGAQSVYPQHPQHHHQHQYNTHIPVHLADTHQLMPHHLPATGSGGEGLSTLAYNPAVASGYDQQAARAAEEPANTRASHHHARISSFASSSAGSAAATTKREVRHRSPVGGGGAVAPLGGLGPNTGGEEHMMRMEKLAKQKEYSLRVRALARKALGGAEAAASASGASSQASSSPIAERPRRQSPSKTTQKHPHQPRQKPPARNSAAPPDKHELALARREKIKAFVATIKKPTVFARESSPAIVTRAELRARAVALEAARDNDDHSDAGSELRKLEEEHQQAMKEVDGIRRALKI